MIYGKSTKTLMKDIYKPEKKLAELKAKEAELVKQLQELTVV